MHQTKVTFTVAIKEKNAFIVFTSYYRGEALKCIPQIPFEQLTV